MNDIALKIIEDAYEVWTNNMLIDIKDDSYFDCWVDIKEFQDDEHVELRFSSIEPKSYISEEEIKDILRKYNIIK